MKTLYNTVKAGLAGLSLLAVSGCGRNLTYSGKTIEGVVLEDKFVDRDYSYNITLSTKEGRKVVIVWDDRNGYDFEKRLTKGHIPKSTIDAFVSPGCEIIVDVYTGDNFALHSNIVLTTTDGVRVQKCPEDACLRGIK